MSRILVLVGLAGCGMAFADPTADEQAKDARFKDLDGHDQPQSLDELEMGMRFHLTTSFGKPPPPLELAPTIDFTLALDLDTSWPGRRLTLSPHFPITSAFENGGDSWADLCDARGRAHSRDATEVLAYLSSWCDLRTNQGAVEQLIPLVSAHARGLASAARDDLADILADDHVSTEALAWLDRHHILTLDVIDALATSYAASNQNEEARRVLEYERSHDPFPSPDVDCRRLQHEAAVGDATMREQIERDLLATPATDPTCARIAAPLRCQRESDARSGVASCDVRALERVVAADTDRCRPYLNVHPESKPGVALLALRQHWPAWSVGSCHWQSIAEVASKSMSVPGAERLALTALGNGVIDSECDARTCSAISKTARNIKRDRAHAAAQDARIAELSNIDAGSCRAFHR
jgi:hypothetical protein